MPLVLVGVDHRSASPAVRASLVLSPSQVDAGLEQLAALHPEVEALVLATCARTEVVLAGDDAADAVATWHGLLAVAVTGTPASAHPTVVEEACAEVPRRVLTGAAVVRHVLRVTAGLDSPLLGDVDVLAQLRDAAARSEAAGLLGPQLRALVDQAITVGRRARSTTDIAAGAPSIAGAVVGRLRELAADRGHVVVVGAGAVAKGVVAGVAETATLTIVNRTPARATALVAGRPAARAVGLDQLPAALADADVVVLATAGGVVVDRDTAVDTGLVGRGVPVLDASAPAAVAAVDGLDVTTLAELHARRDAATAQREHAVPAVETLVEDAVAAWRASHDREEIERAIASLYSAAPELVDELTSLVQAEGDAVAVERAVRRFLHDHVTTLREVSGA